jgi:uncharacterized membrane protein YfcA
VLIGLVLGAVIGAAGGLFGIGGGLIAIPILGIFFALDQQHAQGTAMVMVMPNVITGLIGYAKRGPMNPRIALTLAITAVPFTYLGAHFAVHAPSELLRRGFAFFLIALAIYFSARALARSRPPSATATAAWWWAAPVGAMGGSLSGLFSVGGAVFAVPILALLFGLSQAAAQGLGLALVAPGTVVGLIAYIRAGDVDWALGIPLALGGFAFVNAGVKLAYRLPDRTLRLLFSLLLAASAAALFWKS